MANVKVIYLLSEEGRKSDLLAGGTGQRQQEMQVGREDGSFVELLGLSQMKDDGPVLDTTATIYEEGGNSVGATHFAAPPTAAEIVADTLGRREKLAEALRQRRQDRRERTLEVLASRTVRKSRKLYQIDGDSSKGCANYDHGTPDWPYDRDQEVVDGPEAREWLTEIDEANAAEEALARVAALRDGEAKRLARDEEAAAKLARQEAEAKRREALGMGEHDYDIKIEDGALCRVPCWERHSRGKNWLALISVSPSSPGGLARDFAAKAKGNYYYMVPSWGVGDAVEFGADYYSGSGKKSAERWYGYVKEVLADRVILTECATGKAACKAGEKHAAKVTA